MDETNQGGSGSSLPPFLTKTYEMVDDSSLDSIVSWSQSNKSFIVWNPTEFSRDLLPRFFKHNNFSSFIRQLNTYGFRKADPEQWEFANDDFVRGQPHLMKNIHRRKPVHSHSSPNLQNPLIDSERLRMNIQIERLTKEKEELLEELQKQEKEREGFEMEVKELKDRLQHMEKRQKTMVTFVSEVLEKPKLALNLYSCLPETNERKRRLPRIEPMLEENQTCLVMTEEGSTSQSEHQVEQLESSIAIWENLVSDSCENMLLSRNMSTLNMDEASTCPDSPPLSCIQLSIDTCLKSPPSPRNIDMNSDPVKQQSTVAAPPPVVPVNDVFWQQFFTENPGSTEKLEVQSDKKDDKAEDRSEKFWSNSRNVNTITEQFGHLTSSDKT